MVQTRLFLVQLTMVNWTRKMTFGPWSFRLNWTRYNRLSLEYGPNPTFHGHLDHGQLDQEKSRLVHGPFVWIGLGTIGCLWKLVQTRLFMVSWTMVNRTKKSHVWTMVLWTMVQTGPLFFQGGVINFGRI
jgi:hypothetical protein